MAAQDLTSAGLRATLDRWATVLDSGFGAREAETAMRTITTRVRPLPLEEIPLPNTTITKWSTKLPKYTSTTLEIPLSRSALSLMKAVLGGTPITYQQALELRCVVHGSGTHVFSTDWRREGLRFQPEETPYPYGLYANRNGSRGIVMCVQAYVIRHLVFKYDTKEDIFSHKFLRNRLDDTRNSYIDPAVLNPSPSQKRDALITALSTILWRAGGQRLCRVGLPQDRECFKASSHYRYDGIAERLHIFEFTSLEDLKMFVKRYLSYFESEASSGVILFLYSLVLSRTVTKIRDDTGDVKPQLLTDMEECTRALINLLLTGSAVKHLHNGDILYDLNGQALTKPVKGVAERGDIGFLWFHKEEEPRERTQVGSMLKTPKFPIWVTQINNVNFGILFSINRDLISDWRQEHRFNLHYYTGLSSQSKATKLTVDTRFGRKGRAKTARSRKDEEKKIPPVEQCILSKWPGAEVDWNGILAFI